MVKPDLGTKRQCQSCAAKFFDLSRTPIVCPKCAAVFQITAASRAQPRSSATSDDDDDADTGAVELVSLEDADAGESKDVAAATEGIEIDDDANADETFLEEEEEESDVAGLIDSDIADDEEA